MIVPNNTTHQVVFQDNPTTITKKGAVIMKKNTSIISILAVLVIVATGTVFGGVPLNSLDGAGGIAFNPLAYTAGGKLEDNDWITKPQLGVWYVKLSDSNISPNPTHSFHCMTSATSSGPTEAPVSSKPGTAGTQEGMVSMIFSGVRAASSNIYLTPSFPRTLQISCGSMNMAPVP